MRLPGRRTTSRGRRENVSGPSCGEASAGEKAERREVQSVSRQAGRWDPSRNKLGKTGWIAPGDAGPEIPSGSVPATAVGLDAHGAGAGPLLRTSQERPDLLASSMRRLTGGGRASWLVLVVLFPLSVYGWAPDGLFESWYAPVHVLWAIACGAALHCAPVPSSGGGFRARLPTLSLVAGVYGVAGLVSWRAREWSAHPDRMPGVGADHPHLEALDGIAFLAAVAVLGALWLRSTGSIRGRVLTNEGGSPC